MKQMNKELFALVLGLLGILTMNAQEENENVVKNGDFNDGTNHWQTNSTKGTIGVESFSSNKPGGDDDTALAVRKFIRESDEYVFQKIEGVFSGRNFDFRFSRVAWGTHFDAELEWSTGKVDVLRITTDNGFIWVLDNRLTGQAPIGAEWVKVKFVCTDDIDGSSPQFYIDDVFLSFSGEAIIPVPLDAPKNVQVSNVAKGKFTLSWEAVKDAEGYEIKVNGQTVKVTETTYNVENLDPGKKYPISIKGYSYMTETITDKNGVADLDVFTLGNEKADGEDVFFEGGTFKNGDADLNKGWRNNSAVTTTDADVDGNISTKMKIQNGTTAVIVRSYDFPIEAGKKYTVSAMAKASTKEESEGLTFNIVWKRADGSHLPSGGTTTVGKTEGDTWGTIINEVTAPEGAVIAEVQFQLPTGSSHGQALVFYVDNIQVIKGEVAPTAFKVSEKNQRNVTLSWGVIDGKSYKVVVNGKTLEADGNMVRVNGLVPNTEYTAEVYPTSTESKKSSVTFKTNDFVKPEGERIAHLSNIDANGVIPQEFFYNIEELGGDAIKTVEFVYNGLPVEESIPGKISLPETEGKKLVVKITQENGNQTTLTYYVVTFKK